MRRSPISREQAMDTILGVHAAESCCTEEDLLADRVTICERRPERVHNPSHRRFPRWEPDFGIVSFGRGAVVSSSASILPWVRELFAGIDRDSVFESGRLGAVAQKVSAAGQSLFGPNHLFVSTSDDLRTVRAPTGVRIEFLQGPAAMSGLRSEDWPHSLPEKPGRPIRAFVIARRDSRVIGIATAAEDAPKLWQIGIDVAREERGRGVGKAMTAALCGAVLESGAVPYYGTSVANIPSMRTALSAGFWPAWTEVWAKQWPATARTQLLDGRSEERR